MFPLRTVCLFTGLSSKNSTTSESPVSSTNLGWKDAEGDDRSDRGKKVKRGGKKRVCAQV